MHPKLSQLSSEQIHELIERYYEGGEKVAALIQYFNLDVQPGALVSTFPPYIHDDLYCPYCDSQNLVSKRLSRDQRNWAIDAPVCPLCKHRGQGYCRCKNCVNREENVKRQIKTVKQEIITSLCQGHFGPAPELNDLSLRDALYILSVSRHSLSEDFYSITPFDDHLPLLAPTFEYQNEITKHLYSKRFISISSDSDVEAFEFNDELTEIEAYYPNRVIWKFLPSMMDGERQMYLRELETLVKEGQWADTWKGEIDSLWCHIVKYECFEYFSYLLSQRGYEPENFGSKTHSVYEAMLQRFSVSQIFNLTWQAVRDTTDYIVREGLPRYHAKNSFIGAIQRKADKALAEGWEVRHSRRDFKCPQTVVSSTFFDAFLGIGQAAFDTVPHSIC